MMMAAALAPVAWFTQEVMSDGLELPLQTWTSTPAADSADVSARAVTVSAGACWVIGM
ncbi:hypothetical protein [Parafrankia sp. CH37]|uniref:hypothetical protein n=1 Tax=Parafrankia sp. CH37 TaxID=683308 RepID=UPI001D026612|nr:hypothetical protein [Parafrankia sp. CH37]